jgi:hypothetical protein
MTDTPRERLLAEVATMTDEQIEKLLRYVQVMESDDLSPDYDQEHDPAVGFFSGPTDLSTRTREILEAEFGLDYPKEDET